MKTKYCSGCEREKPIAEFSKKRDGHQSQCKLCIGDKRRAHHQIFKYDLRARRLARLSSMQGGTE